MDASTTEDESPAPDDGCECQCLCKGGIAAEEDSIDLDFHSTAFISALPVIARNESKSMGEHDLLDRMLDRSFFYNGIALRIQVRSLTI